MKTLLKLSLVVGCGIAMVAFAVEPSAALFENDSVKVSLALEKAHVKGSFHEHKTNRVMVYFQNGRQRFEYQDGRPPAVFDWKAGQIVWSKPEGMHSPEVVSDEPFNIVEVELKKPGTAKAAGPADAISKDGKHYKVELENEQVRVLRLQLAAHQSTASQEHARNSVTVFLAGDATHKAGDAVWETPGTRKIENTGDKPLELVLIELKY